MTDDKEILLDALYKRHLTTGKRASVVEAQMNYLPEWDRTRLLDAAKKLEADGDRGAKFCGSSSTFRLRFDSAK